MLQASVSWGLNTKPNLLRCCPEKNVLTLHFYFCMYSWHSLKSELCSNHSDSQESVVCDSFMGKIRHSKSQIILNNCLLCEMITSDLSVLITWPGYRSLIGRAEWSHSDQHCFVSKLLMTSLVHVLFMFNNMKLSEKIIQIGFEKSIIDLFLILQAGSDLHQSVTQRMVNMS